MTSMVVPFIAVTRSPGLLALPSGRFSDVGTSPWTSTPGFRSASAWNRPITAAPPDMSYFISSIFAAGLMLIPPASKVSPFPTTTSFFFAFFAGL